MKDFFTFRVMITPWLLQILFWIALIVFICIAIVDIIQHVQLRVVLEIIILGPLATRIVCEILIVFFRMNDNLTKINNKLSQ